MKKKIIFSAKGQRADIGKIPIYRILENRYADKVASFVLLDHIPPKIHKVPNNSGTGAHPHRGIATLTYVINGQVEHFDSRGNHQLVHSGGIQWMKAGNGIIHEERLNYDSKTDSKLTHAFQFWINLPSKIKAENPEYLAIQADDVPLNKLEDQSGWLKVIVGEFKGLHSEIPNYLEQFLYHIHLEPGKQFSLEIENKIEVAAFLPIHKAVLNGIRFDAGEFIAFDTEQGTIEILNTTDQAIDVLLFGGETYTEPIKAEGPFVMNTTTEIAEAYRDFYIGIYGAINNL